MTLKTSDISYYLLCLYTFVIIFSDNTIFMYIATLLFGSFCFLSFIKRVRFVRVDWFFNQHLFFICFCLICSLLGFSRITEVSLNRCLIMAINLYIGVCILFVLNDRTYYERFVSFFVKCVFLFEIYVLALTNVRVFYGRLGEYMYSPIAYGNTYNSNIIGVTFLLAIIFVVFRYCKTKYKYLLFIVSLFLIGIILTGSRKAIICSVICLVLVPFIYIYMNDKHSFIKLFKFTLIACLMLSIIVLLLFKVPVLYEIAGYRVEAFIMNLQNTEVYTDSSLKYRALFIDFAKELFHESPVVGVGIDTFKHLNSIKGYYAHNNYWELLSGSGIIGVVLFYSTYFLYALKARKSLKNGNIEIVPAIVFLVLMLFIDYYMVTYLQRIIILVFFVNYSSLSHRNSNGLTSFDQNT